MNGLSPEMKRYNCLTGEINAAYHEAALAFGFSDSAMFVLYILCDSGGECRLKDICRLSGLSKQTVNSAVRGLERKNIIFLEPCGGRNKKVLLTAAGRLISEGSAMKIISAENAVFAGWEKEEISCYLGLTERFLREFREKIREFKNNE